MEAAGFAQVPLSLQEKTWSFHWRPERKKQLWARCRA